MYHCVLQFYFMKYQDTLSHSYHILCPNITLKQQTKQHPQIMLYSRHNKMRMLEK